jgi:O-succinylbenzoic acid--CoA ligase
VIAWDDRGTEILLNPRLPADERARVHRLIAAVPPLEAHVWLTTSGATGRLKPVALSKLALLVSGRAVNEHLSSDARDTWLNVLPTFHVGGLGIHARAHLSGARVVSMDRWEVAAFGARLTADAVTLTSLVPTQVFDLVQAGLAAPPLVRAAVVGGGALPPDLWGRARTLGWPLLPSYGATECASQIATAAPGATDEDAPRMRLLSHVEVRAGADGRLEVRSDALLTGYATETGFVDPKTKGWWRTDDLGEVQGDTLVVHGRADETVKVGGELVDLAALEARLAEVIAAVAPGTDAALVRVADPRLEWVVGLAVATVDPSTADRVRDAFNAAVLPFERARVARRVALVPRTALGKVARRALEATLGTTATTDS